MAAASQNRLPLFSWAALVIASMTGAGIFSLPGTVAVATGPFGATVVWRLGAGGMSRLARVFHSLAERKTDLDADVHAFERSGFGLHHRTITRRHAATGHSII